MSKSILKWAGGKTTLLPKIKVRLDKISNKENAIFYDLFAGGGSVSFEFSSLFKHTVLNDINKEITDLYKVIKSNPLELIEKLLEYQQKHNKDFYYKIRSLDRDQNYKQLDGITKAARTIYLNKTCFNGLYRVNSKGQFNVPIGRQAKIKIYDEMVFMEIHKKLQNIDITNHDFNYLINNNVPKPGDVVYIDPPYDKISDNSFVEYSTNGFSSYDQERLAKDVKTLTERGVYVIVSNSYTERTKKLYAEFFDKNSIIKVRRLIGASVSSRNQVDEILVDNIKQVKENVNKNKKT
ncbi:MAG TPA: Dam family site-specific DNA-(adenine-N6)-methyltransferase [Gallicola sp.]|nr:Dam family site-specific DNA-(adenine-N6)-methyltransferase [Gallicola sp.]